jgi:hypothetical protein
MDEMNDIEGPPYRITDHPHTEVNTVYSSRLSRLEPRGSVTAVPRPPPTSLDSHEGVMDLPLSSASLVGSRGFQG